MAEGHRVNEMIYLRRLARFVGPAEPKTFAIVSEHKLWLIRQVTAELAELFASAALESDPSAADLIVVAAQGSGVETLLPRGFVVTRPHATLWMYQIDTGRVTVLTPASLDAWRRCQRQNRWLVSVVANHLKYRRYRRYWEWVARRCIY
jgi:hypothetical protein